MLSVASKTILLSVIMLNANMLIVVVLSVVKLLDHVKLFQVNLILAGKTRNILRSCE
jgi:hypothetical protein